MGPIFGSYSMKPAIIPYRCNSCGVSFERKSAFDQHCKYRFTLEIIHNANWSDSLDLTRREAAPLHSLIHLYDSENELTYRHYDFDHDDFPHCKFQVFETGKVLLLVKTLDQVSGLVSLLSRMLVPESGESLKLSDSRLLWSHPAEAYQIIEAIGRTQGYYRRRLSLVATNCGKTPESPVCPESVPMVMSIIGYSGPDSKR
jgi:hypothetical protein